MQLQEIEVFIDSRGRVSIQVLGVKGRECLDLTRALEEALGGQIEAREMTAGVHETQEDVADRQRERSR